MASFWRLTDASLFCYATVVSYGCEIAYERRKLNERTEKLVRNLKLTDELAYRGQGVVLPVTKVQTRQFSSKSIFL